MILLSIFLVAVFSLVACGKSAEIAMKNSNRDFSELLKSYHEDRFALIPLEATFAGDARYNDQLPNPVSDEYIKKLRTFFASYKEKLLKFDKAKLNEDEKTSYDVLLWECDINLDDLKYNMELLPINQFTGFHLTIGQLASGKSAQPFQTVKDYENWLKRLEGFLSYGDTAIIQMRKGIAKSIVLPKSLTDKVIPQIAELAEENPDENIFMSPTKSFPDNITDKDKERLKAAYTSITKEKIIPTLKRLQAFLKDEYLPASRATSGISALPNGTALYQHQIKTYTTTDLSADEIFDLGKKEVERILAEMEKVKKEVGFTGDLKAFFDHVRNRKELMPFKDPKEVIANFNTIHEKMRPNLKKIFDLVPKAGFEVRRTEAFREASASAEYNPPSIDGSRLGVFYVPIPKVEEYNYFADEDLFLHEAIPGHHYQVSLQQENAALPDFRKTLWYSAFGEGWALYAESLGKELGLYQDPYQYFGMLSAEIHRSIRLVVDVGLHAKGWSREQAIEYSLANEAESEDAITSEIERYMALPGQALSYKIGQLKILELRKKAENTFGESFDLKEFHNQILMHGCLPLKTLEEKILAWVSIKTKSRDGRDGNK